jgi:aspartokinase
MVRRNETGRIYGITFIDHNTKSVWNGSRLGKEFSANVFNHWWNEGQKPEIITADNVKTGFTGTVPENLLPDKLHELFNFLNNQGPLHAVDDYSCIESFEGLLPHALGDDYEEIDFANKMKKKRKRKRG